MQQFGACSVQMPSVVGCTAHSFDNRQKKEARDNFKISNLQKTCSLVLPFVKCD